MGERERKYMQMAVDLSINGMRENKGGPFGAIVVKGDQVVGQGCNSVLSSNDPTAHAEVVAIRNACQNLQTFQLDGCEIFTSCEPCPMCLGAIYWARPAKIYYANSRDDAKAIGFDDSAIYEEISKDLEHRSIPIFQIANSDAEAAFQEWKFKEDKSPY